MSILKYVVPRGPISCSLTMVLIGLSLCCGVLIKAYLDLFPSEPLPLYESTEVERICQVFRIDSQDEFCANPSEQNADTVELVLQRYFPLETTFYDDIMSLVEVQFINPSYELLDKLGNSAVGFCPVEQERGRSYSCTILFSPRVLLTVQFDGATEKVERYGAQRPGS